MRKKQLRCLALSRSYRAVTVRPDCNGSVGAQRVGLAGWIIDQRMGVEAEPDEETVKLALAELCERGFVMITKTRRLEATEKGKQFWERLK